MSDETVDVTFARETRVAFNGVDVEVVPAGAQRQVSPRLADTLQALGVLDEAAPPAQDVGGETSVPEPAAKAKRGSK